MPPFAIPSTISNMAAGQIAIMYGLKGICTSVVTACASSNNAIGDSFHRIRDGYEDVIDTVLHAEDLLDDNKIGDDTYKIVNINSSFRKKSDIDDLFGDKSEE